jgi:MFS family permease
MTSEITAIQDNQKSAGIISLLPIIAIVFIAYLIIGFAMPVLPLYVHQHLGFGTFTVGIVAGSQFAAALLTRMWAGQYTDRHGSKRAVAIGMIVASVSGLFCIVSVYTDHSPSLSLSILLAGRALLGSAESFIITGALSWGLGLMGAQHTGKVMSFTGTALYAAYAVGAPVGTILYKGNGLMAIAWATLFLPLAALLLVSLVKPIAPQARTRTSFSSITRAVWVPGLGVALSGVGYGAITTFIALIYASRNWGPVWFAFTALSVAFIAGRLIFGHLPDKIGGAKVALFCILLETAAQLMIWLAPGQLLTLLGIALTGLGYSLVYPAFGVEAIRKAPPENRGAAMGTYTAFLDLSLGVSSPLLGLFASWAGLRSVFLVSTVLVACGAAIALRLVKIKSITPS